MDKATQIEAADAFRRAHLGPRLLLLPNAWDAMSARQFEAAGFGAIATTSAGVAWALGYADGENTPWAELTAATQRIVRAVRLPVTADIETGYGATPADVARSVSEILEAGVVGFNIEDSVTAADQPLRTIDDACARIRAARQASLAAGVPAVINARIDIYLKGAGEPAQRFDATVQRGRAYLAAGADCVYPIGLADPETISRLVREVDAPINIALRPGGAPVAELERIGVARVSIAAGGALAVMSLVRDIAKVLRDDGRMSALERPLSRSEAQALFASHV